MLQMIFFLAFSAMPLFSEEYRDDRAVDSSAIQRAEAQYRYSLDRAEQVYDRMMNISVDDTELLEEAVGAIRSDGLERAREHYKSNLDEAVRNYPDGQIIYLAAQDAVSRIDNLTDVTISKRVRDKVELFLLEGVARVIADYSTDELRGVTYRDAFQIFSDLVNRYNEHVNAINRIWDEGLKNAEDLRHDAFRTSVQSQVAEDWDYFDGVVERLNPVSHSSSRVNDIFQSASDLVTEGYRSAIPSAISVSTDVYNEKLDEVRNDIDVVIHTAFDLLKSDTLTAVRSLF